MNGTRMLMIVTEYQNMSNSLKFDKSICHLKISKNLQPASLAIAHIFDRFYLLSHLVLNEVVHFCT